MNTMKLSEFGDLMKKVIEPVIQDQLFRDTVLLSKLDKNRNVKYHNWTFYITAMTGRHSGVYNVAEWDTINDGRFSTAQMTTKAKYAYGRHTFTDVALEGIEGDAGSLADLLTLATTELKDSISRSFQRQFSSYGRGVLAKVKTGTTGTTITLEWRDQTDFWLGSDYLTAGQKILIGTEIEIKAGTADEVTVVSVPDMNTVVVDSAITVVAEDLIVNQKVWNSTTSEYNEMAGIMNLVDNTDTGALDGIVPDTNFQGVAKATNAWANGYVYKPSSYETLSLQRMTEYYLYCRKYGNPDLIRVNSDLYAKYGALLEGNKRHINTMNLDGWFVGIEFAAGTKPIPVVLDYDTDFSSVEILDTKSFTYGEMAPVGFLDRDGQILRNVGGNSANFTAIMRAYGNLICLKPRANARLTGIKST